MKIADSLLPEFDHEMATTRRVLERVPEDKFDWQPHPKSSTMGRLASHVATIPAWASYTIQQDSVDVAGDTGPKDATSLPDLLNVFDKSAAEARATIAATEDETFFQPWSLIAGDRTIFTMPKIAVMRSFVMNHLIHHRGQLSVYLRLNDALVPSIYGPSADEPNM